jgi:hypothetical protein
MKLNLHLLEECKSSWGTRGPRGTNRIDRAVGGPLHLLASENGGNKDSETNSPNTKASPFHDPAAWEDDFHEWLLMNCSFRDRSFGGLIVLHRHFCDWAICSGKVPCRRDTFEALLAGMGFYQSDGLVYGLLLEELPRTTTGGVQAV